MGNFHFTFKNLENQLLKALDKGYQFISCKDYYSLDKQNILPNKQIIFRVDIDHSVKKAEKLGIIFEILGINASFFIRLHAKEYNPFSFENYRIIKNLIKNGNEIGYHSEIIDQSNIWGEDPEVCLIKDIDILNRIFDIKISGIASHGGMTGLNNLDFWKDKKASDFGLLYEAYDWFNDMFYISDSVWTQWKCYNKGKLKEGDHRSFDKHVMDKHPLIYLLIHSDTYFDRHCYE
jgi:hypothetical protein